MNFGVIRFPGSNCDDDALHAVDRVLASDGQGSRGRILWHKDHDLGDVDAVILPGGFSYGDYLRCGAMAARSPIMAAVKRFELTVDGEVTDAVLAEAQRLADELLSNSVIEDVVAVTVAEVSA